MVGDSHAESLSYEIWKNFKKNYNVNFSIYSGCPFILNLNKVNKKTLKLDQLCTEQMQEKRIEFINRKENSIVILFSRLPLLLNEERFNNFEYGFHEGIMENFFQNDKNSLKTKLQRQENIEINYKKTIQQLLKNNHNVILVYPMPEVGVSVPRIIKNFISN